MDIEGNAVIKEEATRFFIQLLGGNVDTSNSEARRNPLESFLWLGSMTKKLLRWDEEEEIASIRSATKSSIEVLKKVTLKLDDSCSKRECAICLETFCAGLEVTRMPCSHMFHGNCIARWLEKSSLCPLCRFAMPVH
ncbi:unnamed protein product [Ilex paraguariensis]|uniref:RING-type domain-containing protein n=1 Tax=Ilex paraguariensis TaxID=185542 RepID=A0ABC8T7E0_9AQUA